MHSKSLDHMRDLLVELARGRSMGFCIGDETIHEDEFFNYETGMPLVCLPGINIARMAGWPNELLLVELKMNSDHLAGCEVVLNENVSNHDLALFSTTAFISKGFGDMKRIIEPRMHLGATDYYAIEDIAKQIIIADQMTLSNPDYASDPFNQREHEAAIMAAAGGIVEPELLTNVDKGVSV